jgi:hypothetical protein
MTRARVCRHFEDLHRQQSPPEAEPEPKTPTHPVPSIEPSGVLHSGQRITALSSSGRSIERGRKLDSVVNLPDFSPFDYRDTTPFSFSSSPVDVPKQKPRKLLSSGSEPTTPGLLPRATPPKVD